MKADVESAPTYVTIADRSYFTGTVALVNSLHVTSNPGRVVVLDGGLTEDQTTILERAAEVRRLPVQLSGSFVVFLKAAAHMLDLTGTLVLLDSDIVVTGPLAPIVAEARSGRIAAFIDEPIRDRAFPEWRSTLGVKGDLRVQPYLNVGLIAIDLDAWPGFFERWWELCLRVPDERQDLPFDLANDVTHPFAFPEQDVFNALLMTEIDPGRIVFHELAAAPGPSSNDTVRIVDRSRLVCANGDRPTTLLHYWNHPKPWLPNARSELAFDAYVEVLARLLTADDVPVRLDPSSIPLWLRDTPTARFVRRTPRRARRGVRKLLRLLPDRIEQRARDIGGTIATKVRVG